MVLVAVLIMAALSALIPWVVCEDEAQGAVVAQREARRAKARQQREDFDRERDRSEKERDARWAKIEAETEARRVALQAELENAPPPKKREVRRFQWESPAETRGKVWNVPDEETELDVLTAFLRICIAEADGNSQDCVGIWQVFKNIRRRACDRGEVRRITECDEDGETMLSVMRRSQRHVLGYVPIRNGRAAWISKLTTDCDVPEGWTGGESQWDAQYGAKRCPHVVELGRYLLKGELPPRRPGVDLAWLGGRPMTWGGRCESKTGACDDRIACSRGLARIEDTDTLNAFWCRPGQPGCRTDPEPICVQLGYGLPAAIDSTHEQHGQDHPGRQGVSGGGSGEDVGGPRDELRREEEHVEAGASS